MIALPASDTAKVALLIGAFIGVYALSRWAARQTESIPPTPDIPLEPSVSPLLESPRQWPKIVPIDTRSQFVRTETVDEDALRPVRILNLYFSRFDLIPGPPDPHSFADELFVDLDDENSGHKWTNSYFVTTPRGLDQMLEEEHWQYAFADRTFFVRSYDAKVIRQMVVEILLGTQERPRPPKSIEDSYV
jgi:hypothetical protein